MSARRTWAKRAAIALAVSVAALGAAALYLLGTYDAAPVDPAWLVAASAEIPPGSVTVRWTGTATLVISDGWFTRPGLISLLFGKIAPDVDAVARGLARNGIDAAHPLTAVFPVHSH